MLRTGIKAVDYYVPEKVVPATKGYFDEKVAIIGAGPAGISCAYYLAEKGYTNVTVFEKPSFVNRRKYIRILH